MKKYNQVEREEVKKSDFYRYQKDIKKSKKQPSENNIRQKKSKRELIIAVSSIITGMGIMIWLKEIFIGFMLIICGVGLAVMNIKQQMGSRNIDAPDEEPAEKDQSNYEDSENTTPIDNFDSSIKHRVLLEKKISSYDIKYIRVKSTNYLVVNGKIYDEYKGVIEFEHELVAVIDGRKIAAGLDENSYSYIKINGKIVISKERLI